ncbi:MAG: response regulator transcription factor [Lachnospiraceae bacterium]|nr:response regulator transcription factor [Lachnospiraceae bacterium]
MANRRKIMIVDNDRNIAELISLYLNKEFYDTITIQDGQSALVEYPHYHPDMILLSLMLPGTDGLQVCRQIRSTSHVPIIILSEKADVFDRVLGLEMGADDYLAKPFDNKELAARIKALFRRIEWCESSILTASSTGQNPNRPKTLRFPDLTINLSNYAVTYKNKMLDMPPKEIELLHFLASSPNQVFTREQLLQNIWGYDYVGDTRTVDVHIKRIREKIQGSAGWYIGTVWGVGYRFSTGNSA